MKRQCTTDPAASMGVLSHASQLYEMAGNATMHSVCEAQLREMQNGHIDERNCAIARELGESAQVYDWFDFPPSQDALHIAARSQS